MKKTLCIFISVLTIVLMFTGCSKSVDNITFANTEASMEIGQSMTIEYSVTPEDVKNPKIEWTSSDESIATVDNTGNVTSIKDGEVEITATSGDTAKDTCKIKVLKKETLETDGLKIEGVYVNEGYKTKKESSKRLVYVLYEVSSTGTNLKIDAKSLSITFDDKNTYNSARSQSNTKYMPSYYESAYLKEVNVGESLKVVETFEIPEAELTPGKIVTFEKSQIEQFKNLSVRTDSFIKCKDAKEVAKQADPKGYKVEMDARKDADAKTVSKVKKEIDGYQWEFYVNSISFSLEFYGNKYQLRTNLGSEVNGKYTVKKGYIFLKNDDNGAVTEIPYSFDNGKFDLDVISAYDPGK